MKKFSMFAITLILAAVFALFAAAPAFAADYADINEEDVKYAKTDISDIRLSDKEHSYTIVIDSGALKEAEARNKNFKITMDNLTLSFPSAVFYTNAYQKAIDSKRPVEVKLLVKTRQGFDMGNYFNSGVNNNYQLTTEVTKLEAELYISGVKDSDMNKFAKPLSFCLNYRELWNNASTAGKSQSAITLAWYDFDRVLASYPEWERLATKVDLNAQTATAQDIYGCGVIAPIICPDLNNASGGNNNNNGSTTPVSSDYWAAEAISDMQQAGIVPKNTAASKYNQPIGRAEFTAYLVRTLGLETDTSAVGKFKDVSTSNPYYNEIYTGVKAGLVSGTSANTFSPNAHITRQEIAVFFTRALNLKNCAVSTDKTKLAAMRDYASIAVWSKDSCAVAVNSGLITGRGSGANVYFAPKADTSWAEAVVMLDRLRGIIY